MVAEAPLTPRVRSDFETELAIGRQDLEEGPYLPFLVTLLSSILDRLPASPSEETEALKRWGQELLRAPGATEWAVSPASPAGDTVISRKEEEGGAPGDPTAPSGTDHGPVGLPLGHQLRYDEKSGLVERKRVEPSLQGEVVEGRRRVTLTNTPKVIEGDGKASEADLFREDPEGQEIERQRGTMERPEISRFPVQESIYIEGGPKVEDVMQGEIGDCYFHAAVLGIVARDPAKIQQMIKVEGKRATVTFFRGEELDPKTKKPTVWIPTPVVVSTELLVKGAGEQIRLKGAGVRVANAPRVSRWRAEIDERELTIVKVERYEWALWAPLLEKAYARFTEQYGPYGHGDAQGGSGYEGVDGGLGGEVLPLFYGNDLIGTEAKRRYGSRQFDLAFSMDLEGKINENNLKAMQLLAAFSDQQGTAAQREQRIVVLGITEGQAVDRCATLVDDVLMAKPSDELARALHEFKAPVSPWLEEWHVAHPEKRKAREDWEQESGFQAINRDLLKAAEAIFAPGAYPELTDPTQEKSFHDLYEHLPMVVHAAWGLNRDPNKAPADEKRRHIYPGHAYHLARIEWAFQYGQPVPITSGNVKEEALRIDRIGTKLWLINPYGRNEPDLNGDGPDTDAANDGQFTMTLDQALRSFGLIQGGTPRSSQENR